VGDAVKQITGDGGINIDGNNNTLNLYKQPIKYDLLSKLCKDLIDSDLNFNEDMNINELPVELLEKIEYNHLTAHKELYEEFGMYFLDIDGVVKKSLGDNSIKLVRIIKTLYLEILANDPNQTADQILFNIENKLMNYTSLIDSTEYLNEDVRYSISQIVLYVFEKCQILKKPKK